MKFAGHDQFSVRFARNTLNTPAMRSDNPETLNRGIRQPFNSSFQIIHIIHFFRISRIGVLLCRWAGENGGY